MEFVSVNKENISLLEKFIANIGDAGKTFRYFEKRGANVIEKHLTTLLLVDKFTPIAYGHLEIEDGVTWLGICVIPEYNGKGYGSLMMKMLIQKAKELSAREITLTVDKINESAIDLYTRMGFRLIATAEKYFKYQLRIE